jgi:hypothetical protein
LPGGAASTARHPGAGTTDTGGSTGAASAHALLGVTGRPVTTARAAGAGYRLPTIVDGGAACLAAAGDGIRLRGTATDTRRPATTGHAHAGAGDATPSTRATVGVLVDMTGTGLATAGGATGGGTGAGSTQAGQVGAACGPVDVIFTVPGGRVAALALLTGRHTGTGTAVHRCATVVGDGSALASAGGGLRLSVAPRNLGWGRRR